MESLLAIIGLLVAAAGLFVVVTFIEALGRSATHPGWPRTIGLAAISCVFFALGLFTGVVDPRHGSEIVGIPLLIVSVLGAIGFVLRLGRHLSTPSS